MPKPGVVVVVGCTSTAPKVGAMEASEGVNITNNVKKGDQWRTLADIG